MFRASGRAGGMHIRTSSRPHVPALRRTRSHNRRLRVSMLSTARRSRLRVLVRLGSTETTLPTASTHSSLKTTTTMTTFEDRLATWPGALSYIAPLGLIRSRGDCPCTLCIIQYSCTYHLTCSEQCFVCSVELVILCGAGYELPRRCELAGWLCVSYQA